MRNSGGNRPMKYMPSCGLKSVDGKESMADITLESYRLQN